MIAYAFEYARRHGRKKVTLVHKANILKMSNGLFLDVGREVAQRYPEIAFEDMIVDATAMKLVTAPERFDVIVTMNLFGDILSRPHGRAGRRARRRSRQRTSATDGWRSSRPCTAPRPTSPASGIANPTALMLSAAMLLEHVGQGEAASRLRAGVHAALGGASTRTGDLGGTANTARFTDAVCGAIAGAITPR